MDRYSQILDVADLGLVEDGRTEDLRRIAKTRGDGARTPDVTTGSNPTTL